MATDIYVLNKSTVVSNTQVKKWCTAVTKQITRDVVPFWGFPPRRVHLVRKVDGFFSSVPRNAWVIVVMDDADQAGELGYHSVDSKGRTYGRVFAGTALDYNESPSVTFSHEVLETLGDPGVDKWVSMAGTDLETPVELCDAVEGDYYYVNHVRVSNFLLPEWFGWTNLFGGEEVQFDYLARTSAPFTMSPGGYMVRRAPDGTTDAIFAERAKLDYITERSHPLGRAARRQA